MSTEGFAELVGKTGETRIMEVEKGAIRRYADAIDDENPLYWDEEYAKKSRYGAMIAPPGFFGWPTKFKGVDMPAFPKLLAEMGAILAEAGYGRTLDGGMEYEFILPVLAGDVLTATPKVVSVTERETKTGKLAFLVTETTYTNETGDVVAKARQTTIHR